jgi:hypothetical protein
MWCAFAGAGGGSASKGKAGAGGVVAGSVTKSKGKTGLI